MIRQLLSIGPMALFRRLWAAATPEKPILGKEYAPRQGLPAANTLNARKNGHCRTPATAAVAADGSVILLRASDIAPSRWRGRDPSAHSDAEFQELANLIETAGGNSVPIKVRPVAQTSCKGVVATPSNISNAGDVGGSKDAANVRPPFEIVYGSRRWHACMHHGLPVSAIVEEMGDIEHVCQMIAENSGRSEASAWERGLLYRQLLKDKLFQNARQLALALKVDPGTISRSLTLAQLPSEFIKAMTSPRDLALHDAEKLRGVDPEKLIEIADKVQAAGRGPIACKALIGLLATPDTKVTLPTVPQRFEALPINVAGRRRGELTLSLRGQITVQIDDSNNLEHMLALRALLASTAELWLTGGPKT